jgi:hypothetical protein
VDFILGVPARSAASITGMRPNSVFLTLGIGEACECAAIPAKSLASLGSLPDLDPYFLKINGMKFLKPLYQTGKSWVPPGKRSYEKFFPSLTFSKPALRSFTPCS